MALCPAGLSAATVTVTASTTIDAWAIAYASVTIPSNVTNPLDPDANLPIEATHETTGGGTDPGVTGLSQAPPADRPRLRAWSRCRRSDRLAGPPQPARGQAVAAVARQDAAGRTTTP